MLRHVIQGVTKKNQSSFFQLHVLKRARAHTWRTIDVSPRDRPRAFKSSTRVSSSRIMRSIHRGFCSETSTFRDEDFLTLHAIRVSAQKRYEDRPFLGTKNLSTNEFEYVTYGEFGRKVDQLAGVLVKERGVKPGDKIAVISKNREEWAVAAYASFAIGAHYVRKPRDLTLEDHSTTTTTGTHVRATTKRGLGVHHQ